MESHYVPATEILHEVVEAVTRHTVDALALRCLYSVNTHLRQLATIAIKQQPIRLLHSLDLEAFQAEGVGLLRWVLDKTGVDVNDPEVAMALMRITSHLPERKLESYGRVLKNEGFQDTALTDQVVVCLAKHCPVDVTSVLRPHFQGQHLSEVYRTFSALGPRQPGGFTSVPSFDLDFGPEGPWTVAIHRAAVTSGNLPHLLHLVANRGPTDRLAYPGQRGAAAVLWQLDVESLHVINLSHQPVGPSATFSYIEAIRRREQRAAAVVADLLETCIMADNHTLADMLVTSRPAQDLGSDVVMDLLAKAAARQGRAGHVLKHLLQLPAAQDVPAAFICTMLRRWFVQRGMAAADLDGLLQLPNAQLISASDLSDVLVAAVTTAPTAAQFAAPTDAFAAQATAAAEAARASACKAATAAAAAAAAAPGSAANAASAAAADAVKIALHSTTAADATAAVAAARDAAAAAAAAAAIIAAAGAQPPPPAAGAIAAQAAHTVPGGASAANCYSCVIELPSFRSLPCVQEIAVDFVRSTLQRYIQQQPANADALAALLLLPAAGSLTVDLLCVLLPQAVHRASLSCGSCGHVQVAHHRWCKDCQLVWVLAYRLREVLEHCAPFQQQHAAELIGCCFSFPDSYLSHFGPGFQQFPIGRRVNPATNTWEVALEPLFDPDSCLTSNGTLQLLEQYSASEPSLTAHMHVAELLRKLARGNKSIEDSSRLSKVILAVAERLTDTDIISPLLECSPAVYGVDGSTWFQVLKCVLSSQVQGIPEGLVEVGAVQQLSSTQAAELLQLSEQTGDAEAAAILCSLAGA